MEALMVNITDPKVDEMSFEDLKQALKEEVARRKVFQMEITNLKSLLEQWKHGNKLLWKDIDEKNATIASLKQQVDDLTNDANIGNAEM